MTAHDEPQAPVRIDPAKSNTSGEGLIEELDSMPLTNMLNPWRKSDRTVGALCAIPICILIGMTALMVSACNIVGPAAYLIEGPVKADAVYTLPEKKVVVFVDDRSSIIPRVRLRRILAERTTNELLRNQRLVPSAVQPDAAVRVAQTEDVSHLLSIDEIGRRVGAEIIIYVRPRAFAISSAGLPKPMAACSIKVIDCQTGHRLFPTGDEGRDYMVTATMAAKTGSRYKDAQAVAELEETLADFTGLRIAQIFYPHEANPLDGEVSK